MSPPQGERVEHSASRADAGLRLNEDLVERLNELTEGPHTSSECWSSARPMLIEGLLWVGSGAILWAIMFYLAS